MDGQDLGLYGRVLIRHALSLQVIVERAARQLCRFEQGLKRILLPQSSHEPRFFCAAARFRSEEHTSELQSLMRISYAVFCLKKKKKQKQERHHAPTKYTRYN